MGAVVEPLECRRLLSGAPAVAAVDLAGRIVAQPLNELLVTVRAGAHGSAAVQVVNLGAVPAVGSLTITLHISPGSVFADGLRAVGRKSIPRVKLRPGGSQLFEVGFVLPAGLRAGGYHLFAVISGSHGIVETNPGNNTAGSIAPIAVTNTRIVGGTRRHVHQQSYWCNVYDTGFDTADEALLAGSSAVLGGTALASTNPSDSSDATTGPATEPSTQPSETGGDSSDATPSSSSDDSGF